jgi:hypothetical protein
MRGLLEVFGCCRCEVAAVAGMLQGSDTVTINDPMSRTGSVGSQSQLPKVGFQALCLAGWKLGV